MTNIAKRVSLVTLAIAEIVAFAVAAGTVGNFMDQSIQPDSNNYGIHQLVVDMGIYGRHEFFLFAVGVGFFVSISSLILAMANLQDKIHLAAIMITLHAFCALALLVSSSLLAKTTQTYDSKKVCKGLDVNNINAQCYQMIIGVAFGFVSMALLIGDIILYVYTLAGNTGISFVNMADIK